MKRYWFKEILLADEEKSYEWIVFGGYLRQWIKELDWNQVTLCIRLGLGSSTISDWASGSKRPAPKNLVRVLDEIRREKEAQIQPADILDALFAIEYCWDDILKLVKHIPQESQSEFKRWWRGLKPEPPPPVLPPEPAPFDLIPFLEAELIVDNLVAWESYRQRRYHGAILGGISGAGKTTLAITVANDPKIRALFRGGVLWIGERLANCDNLIERLCGYVGIIRESYEEAVDAWRRWIGEPERRVLLVIDDVTSPKTVDSLLRHAGPLVSFLITTQKGQEVLNVLQIFPKDRVLYRVIHGFSPDTARAFVEKRVGRTLIDSEWFLMQQIGTKLGWYPEAVRLASGEKTEHWAVLVDEMEEGAVSFVSLESMLERTFQRIGDEYRDAVFSLTRWMDRPSAFGISYAAAIWRLRDLSETKYRLDKLERAGVVERLATGDPARLIDGLWRVLPVIARTQTGTAGLRELEKEWFEIRRGALARYIPQDPTADIRVPWQFGLWGTMWWLGTLGGNLVYRLPSKATHQKRSESRKTLIAAARLWQREREVRGISLPMEYTLLNAGRIRAVWCSFGLVWGGMLLLVEGISFLLSIHSSPVLLQVARLISALPLWLFVFLMVSYFVATQAYLAVPNLWLLYRIGVEHDGLSWVVRQARRWGMREDI